jgi:hypothetical protein
MIAITLNVNPIGVDKNKYNHILDIPNEFKLDSGLVAVTDMQKLNDKYTELSNIDYPVFFKGVYDSGFGKNIDKIDNIKDAIKYISETRYDEIMYQKLSPYKKECNVIFVKKLFNKNEVKLLNLIYIDKPNSKNITYNTHEYKQIDITNMITPALTKTVGEIMSKIPNMYMGSLDISFSNFDSLKKGSDMKVIEITPTFGLLRLIQASNSYLDIINNIFRYAYFLVSIGIINTITFRGYNPLELMLNIMLQIIDLFLTSGKSLGNAFIF